MKVKSRSKDRSFVQPVIVLMSKVNVTTSDIQQSFHILTLPKVDKFTEQYGLNTAAFHLEFTAKILQMTYS